MLYAILTDHKEEDTSSKPCPVAHEAVACTGELEPLPLCGPGLCDMNNIVDDKNQYRRSLYAEYAVCSRGGTIPVAQKTKM